MGSMAVERLKVGLVPEASEALSRLEQHTSMSRVDLINRAIQLYDFLEAEKRHGNDLALIGPNGHIQSVTMS